MKNAILILMTCLSFVACKKEPAPVPTPTPPTGGGSGTGTYTDFFILEFYGPSGSTLHNTVDSIRFVNETTNETELWLGTDTTINWNNHTYTMSGNWRLFYIPDLTYGDIINIKVYFNTTELKQCGIKLLETEPGSNLSLATNTTTTVYEFLEQY